MATSTDPIPAVQEADATGETAEIFADLRATMGVPLVNLIWRHLATMPGMLRWTWSVVKPLHGTDALVTAAVTLRAAVRIPAGVGQPAFVPTFVFDAAGVTAPDRVAIGHLIGDYNTANALNLLGLLAAQSVLAGQPGGAAASSASPGRLGRLGAITVSPSPTPPRLPALAELPPALRALVLDLDTFGRLAPTDAVASLYRHLAHWPSFLAIVHAALAPSHRSGTLRAEHERVRDRAEHLVDRLLPLVHRPGPPPPDSAAAAARSLDSFTRHMIARMVTMGEIMLALLSQADHPA